MQFQRALLIAALVLVLTPAYSQSATPSTLSNYQQNLDQGQLAFKQGDDARALDFFRSAFYENPFMPDALLGIATIYSNRGELIRALMWTEAMREMELDEVTGQAAEDLVTRLEAEIVNTTDGLLRLSERSISQFPAELKKDREKAMSALLLLYSAKGDFVNATRLRSQSLYSGVSEDALRRYYAETLIMARDYQGTEAAAKAIVAPAERDRVYALLAESQATRKEYGLAYNSINAVIDPARKTKTIEKIAIALIRELNLIHAQLFIDQVPEKRQRLLLQDRLVEGHIKAGLLEAGRELAEELIRDSSTESGVEARMLSSLLILAKTDEGLKSRALRYQEQDDVLAAGYRTVNNLAWMERPQLADELCASLRMAEAELASGRFYSDLSCAITQTEKGQLQDLSPLFLQ